MMMPPQGYPHQMMDPMMAAGAFGMPQQFLPPGIPAYEQPQPTRIVIQQQE